MMLKNIMVNKGLRTEDILNQVSEKTREEFKTKFEGSVKAFVNANNKGYCQVQMSEDELRFFGDILDKLDTVNRCYLWRILWSHVKRGRLTIDDYMSIFINKFSNESNEDVVLFLLDKVSWLVSLGLIDKPLMKREND